MIILRKLVAVTLIVQIVAGCSHSESESLPDVYSVSGTLMYRGNPVSEAQLTFWPGDESEPSFATTDHQGRFRCLSNDADGIPPGEYIVTLSKRAGGIPEKYADIELSPLQLAIEHDDGNVALELVD